MNSLGAPHGRAAVEDGFVLRRANDDKHSKYRDISESRVAELIVLARETGGRWNRDALNLIDQLSQYKVAATPPLLRRAAQAAWANRWWAMLAVATQDSLAASILAEDGRRLVLEAAAAPAPDLDEVLDGQRWG